jgi:hypothetical protein
VEHTSMDHPKCLCTVNEQPTTRPPDSKSIAALHNLASIDDYCRVNILLDFTKKSAGDLPAPTAELSTYKQS